MKDVSVIEVRIWGRSVGAVTLDPGLAYYAFEYNPAWKKTGIELAPLHMPLKATRSVFVFPALPEATYYRLPALLADALPDDFGNALIDAWMAQRGIEKSSVTVLDRLAYMGKRGMGALEFRPARGSHKESSAPVEMKELVEEARRLVQGTFSVDHEAKAALANIIKVGTSAGGARAKAVIAWNPKTDEVRSGQFDAAPGFEHRSDLVLQAEEYTGQVDPHGSLPLCGGQFVQGHGALLDAGIIEGTIEFSKHLDRVRHERLNLGFRPDIGLDKHGLAATLANGVHRLAPIGHIGNDDSGTRAAENEGACASDAAGGARDDDHSIFQCH